jgi:hypothetical protein
VLLGLGTLTHQPPVDEFDAYARYVTTDRFLAGHIGGSVGGAGLAVLGAIAVTAYLVTGRSGRLAVAGLALTTMSNVYLASTFGSAAFVQPGIGRAHLAGVPGMPALNDETAYGRRSSSSPSPRCSRSWCPRWSSGRPSRRPTAGCGGRASPTPC